ncbi:hypothetical protein [Evansella clarkii]|uniref:hypothetical protein n=1 Tax=Evansella clarkii TaxID=79879 RepID=UPI000998BE04|nr:hypothetical protein [Evansella clarkii]
MKRLLITLSFSTLMVVTACGDDNAGGSRDNNAGTPGNNNGTPEGTNNIPADNNNEFNAVEENSDETIDESGEEGDTIENEAGVFTLHSRADDIDSIETGPIVLEIEQVLAASGTLSEEMAQVMEADEVEYIQVDITVENTAEEDFTFFAGSGTMQTDTGEQLDGDMWLSEHIEELLMAGTTQSASFYYILENSSAEDVEAVRLIWEAPVNVDYEEVGEEPEIEVEF